jgi:hypothetical protein
MTDDMDMLLYDCPFVIRNISLLNKTVWIYDKESILRDLEMTDDEFVRVVVLSGTDYNSNIHIQLDDAFLLWNQYKKTEGITFYEWIINQSIHIDVNGLESVVKLFRVLPTPSIEFNKKKGEQNTDDIQKILEYAHFIFV